MSVDVIVLALMMYDLTKVSRLYYISYARILCCEHYFCLALICATL